MRTGGFELGSSALTSSTLKWLHQIQCGFKLQQCFIATVILALIQIESTQLFIFCHKHVQISLIFSYFQDEAAEFSEEVRDLLTQYNNLVATLSKQFVLWDKVLTATEKNVLPKDKPY
jgi:hypothetical protein